MRRRKGEPGRRRVFEKRSTSVGRVGWVRDRVYRAAPARPRCTNIAAWLTYSGKRATNATGVKRHDVGTHNYRADVQPWEPCGGDERGEAERIEERGRECPARTNPSQLRTKRTDLIARRIMFRTSYVHLIYEFRVLRRQSLTVSKPPGASYITAR